MRAWLVVSGGIVLYAAALRAELVIRPGLESVVMEMCRGSEAQPSACKFEGADIAKTEIHARFECGSAAKRVGVRLRHPEEGRPATFSTKAFAVDVDGPSDAVAALVPELRARIEAAEPMWEWTRTPPPSPVPSARGVPGVPATTGTGTKVGLERWGLRALVLALPLVLLVGRELRALWRRRRAT